ncbi:SF-assemblin [Babesia sp. Xinjiang]|uniref:SF-assemblin n=1 Tax=Babesia sp. Xinjiang TaxID=462227 RepID=UPI000A230842|nr:SF-assemblin [Babesia sp. Xinjiang]ORM40796.1 SF-assemblin [Babesia sp. Xinjiang]
MSDSELLISQGSQCSIPDSAYSGLGGFGEPTRATVVRNTQLYGSSSVHFSGEPESIYRSPGFRQSSHPVTLEGFSAQDQCVVRDVSSDKETKDSRFQGGTKSKLMILSEKLQGFERQMEFHAKQRRMHEEQRFLNISESLSRLDEAISQESKRRMETIKALHGIFESQIGAVQSKVEALFNDKLDQLDSVVQSLSERIAALSTQCEENEKVLHDNLENNCVTLEKNLATVQKLFECEKLSRQEREEHIMKRISEVELQTENAFGKEMQNTENQYQTLKIEFDKIKQQNEEREKVIKASVLDQIAALSNGLAVESCARESADSDLTQALHSFMKVIADVSKLPISG